MATTPLDASQTRETTAHLDLLAGACPADDARIELRVRDVRTGHWSQRFFAVRSCGAAAEFARGLADDHDVYVGVLPRRHDRGHRRDLLPRGRLVWVDLDVPTASDPLDEFPIAPSLIVASGTPGHHHVYWRLDRPLRLDDIEAINQALARRLGGDLQTYDAPRILRLAGTRNHKAHPSTAVRLLAAPDRTADVDHLRRVLDLPEQPDPTAPPRPVAVRRPVVRAGSRSPIDQLEALAPADYVATLTGQPVPEKTRKVRCPLHDDDTPSLHVYETPAEGWFCFGCRRGGRIYDLAAGICGRDVRGSAFAELQRDLVAALVERSIPRTSVVDDA